MPVVRVTSCALLLCVLLAAGCRGEPPVCPAGSLTADPEIIADGDNQSTLSVEVTTASSGFGIDIVTEIHAESGSVADPFARETTFTCAHDDVGPVEICVTTTYSGGSNPASEVTGVGVAQEALRGPNVYLSLPSDCSTVDCIEVVCPELKNQCPEISSLTVEPEVLLEEETATIRVVADDPDDNPEALVTTLTASHGTIGDPNAAETTYQCDPNVGGAIAICVTASDGDSSCGEVERCTTVRCPGDPLENTCPIIESLTATPMTIPPGQTSTEIVVQATDPDDFPVPLRTELSSETGVFDDRFASDTTFTCGEAGPVEICVKANDGDPECNVNQCIMVQCPSDIPANVCPMLFVINGIPRVIPEGQTTTNIETRAQDTDGLPLPLTLTLSTLWGSFENTENMQLPNNVVTQDAIYVCDRPGLAEVCVDATDGACTKTLCDNIVCPDDIPPP